MKAAKVLSDVDFFEFMFRSRDEPYWITPQLGSMSELDGCPKDAVILDVRDFYDGPGNKPKDVWKRIKQGFDIIQSGKRCAVQCTAGISRSNSIAAGILAVLKWSGQGRDDDLGVTLHYMDCLSLVRSKVLRAYPNPEIIATVIAALKLGMWKK